MPAPVPVRAPERVLALERMGPREWRTRSRSPWGLPPPSPHPPRSRRAARIPRPARTRGYRFPTGDPGRTPPETTRAAPAPGKPAARADSYKETGAGRAVWFGSCLRFLRGWRDAPAATHPTGRDRTPVRSICGTRARWFSLLRKRNSWLFPRSDEAQALRRRDQRGGRRSRVCAAILAVFDQHRERDALAGRIRRESDEPGVRRRVGEFRGAGLARDGYGRIGRAPARALRHYFAHEAAQGGSHIRADRRLRRLRAIVAFVGDPAALGQL